jgi:hypothetical protein
VIDEQSEPGAGQHLDVDVGVAAGEGGQSAGLGEDVLGLARPQVQAAEHLIGADDLPVGVRVRGGGADHVLLADAPGLLRERAHEVAAAAGAHEHPELVGLQVFEQLQHRLVDQLDVGNAELGLLDRLHPLVHLRIELVRRRTSP